MRTASPWTRTVGFVQGRWYTGVAPQLCRKALCSEIGSARGAEVMARGQRLGETGGVDCGVAGAVPAPLGPAATNKSTREPDRDGGAEPPPPVYEFEYLGPYWTDVTLGLLLSGV